jgi:hypothetical protein
VAFRVVGEEIVQVPAGRFDCWRLDMSSGQSGAHQLWVSKRDQLLVKSLSGSAEQGVEAVLLSFSLR